MIARRHLVGAVLCVVSVAAALALATFGYHRAILAPALLYMLGIALQVRHLWRGL